MDDFVSPLSFTGFVVLYFIVCVSVLLQGSHEHGSEERNPAPCELSQGGSSGRGSTVGIGAALLGGDGVNVCEADLG